jgi:carboxypeptidase PM20D1
MKKVLLALFLITLLVTGTIIVRTLRFDSKQLTAWDGYDFKLDTSSFIERLSKAIQYRTVSQHPSGSFVEFLRFHEFLQASFPSVHKTLTRETVGNYSLLYFWKGKNEKLKPILLMAHMDVVPVDPATEKNWTYPPFSGQLAGGYIWGRGAMDDKVGVIGVLEAVEQLLEKGFQPQRTIYLAFGHDEEIGGQNGAAKIAARLTSEKVDLEYVLDEGGNITDGIIPDIGGPVALIGIAEKGYVNVELTVDGAGGHSAIPPPHTIIGILSSAIHKLERATFPSRLSEPTRKFFEFVGPEMSWPKRIALANLWLFGSMLERQLAKSPINNAMIRTTQAATMFAGGVKENVLPTHARAVVNFRLLPGDTVTSVVDHVRATIGDPQVKITPLPLQLEPSAVSNVESESFKLLQQTIRQIAPNVVVAPSLLVAATDSRHYERLTKNIFRFLPITLTPEDAKRYHGVDERVSVKDYERCVWFYAKLIADSTR